MRVVKFKNPKFEFKILNCYGTTKNISIKSMPYLCYILGMKIHI